MHLLYPNPSGESNPRGKSIQQRNREAVSRHIDKDPVAYRAKCRAHEQERLNTDPQYRESKRQRNILRATIHRLKKGLRVGYCYQLGYHGSSLRQHLESQWQPGWDWENYGSAWTIDHIQPISHMLAAGERDPGVIHALSNIRPMAKFLNESKHSRSAPSEPRYPRDRVEFTGENHHLSKLTRTDVITIKGRIATEPRCLSKLAREYGVSRNTIQQIKDGKAWKDVTL